MRACRAVGFHDQLRRGDERIAAKHHRGRPAVIGTPLETN
jgi:hypothetical protein